MDAPAAVAQLLSLSTQVVEVVMSGPAGVEAATPAGIDRAGALAAAGTALLDAAASIRPGVAVEQVAVGMGDGALVVVSDGQRLIVVTTVPEPTLGLLAYDLRTTLTSVTESAGKRSTRKRKSEG